MFTPPDSNTPNPRPPRDQDEWVAVLVALGVLGGAMGWILFSRSPFLQSGGVDADLSAIEEALEDSFDSTLQEDDLQEDDLADGTEPSAVTETETTPLFERFRNRFQERSQLTETPDAAQPANSEQPDLDSENTPEKSPEVTPAFPESPNDGVPESSNNAVAVPEPRVPDSKASNTVPVIRDPLVFSDVPNDHWAKPYIDALTARGILNGLPDGTYAPDRPMTRAELAVQVAQAFDVETKQTPRDFSDVPTDHWAASAINEAVTTGFMKGYPNQVFRPDQEVPRVQVLATLVTGLSVPEVSSSTPLLQQYEDQTEIPDWADEKVASALESDLITASPESSAQLRPNAPATRAEVAAILHNALAYLGEIEPIE